MEDVIDRTDRSESDMFDTESRIGLLKYYIGRATIERKIQNENDPEIRSLNQSVLAFMDQEEDLIAQGHNGKYALFYEGELFRVLRNEFDLREMFYQEKGNHAFYIGRIGRDF